MSVSGSLREVSVDGISYRVPGDADITMKFSPFETENIPTSGESVSKMTIISPNHEGIPLSVDSNEIEQLKASAAKTENYSLSCTMADGTEWKSQGRINMKDYSSADGKIEIDLLPANALDGWQKF